MKTIMAGVAAAMAAGLFTLAAAGQESAVPPALMVKQGDKSEPMTLERAAVEVRILGRLAETRMTLTFRNPHGRVLAGDLYFPLPEGATVSGYALDIRGAMVDGVIVEKDRGRQVFESVVRQGIDPGLVEWTRGNNFKTRVFPLPANGTRTIRVDYVSDLPGGPDKAVYRLPLNFKNKLAELSVRVEVAQTSAEPTAAGGPAKLVFEPTANGFAAQAKATDAAADADLVVTVPAAEAPQVAVEKGPDGEFYFAIHAWPTAPADPAPAAAPGRVTVLWDASASHAKADHAREFALLKDYFAGLKDHAVAVELVLFRDRSAEPKRFEVAGGDVTKLLAELSAVAYDGGTQMAAVSPQAGWQKPDLYLLFTDGLSNFGRAEPSGLDRPVYVFSADPTADFAFCRYLAATTGGAYFNLARTDNAAVLAALRADPFSFLAAEFDKAQLAYVFPRMAQPIVGRFTVVGKLLADEASVRLGFGRAGKVQTRLDFKIARAGAASGNLLRRFWAQQRVAELMIFQDRNAEDITAVGKRYGLVTPFTSLIVLDSLEQYLQHGIAPPDSLPEMRKQYEDQVVKRRTDEDRARKEKLDQVVAMWNERVKWWEKEFKYPKDFKYKQVAAKKAGGQGGGLFGDNEAAGGEAAPRPTAPAPSAEPSTAESAVAPAERPGPNAPPPADADAPVSGEGHMEARIYDVHDLLHPLTDFRAAALGKDGDWGAASPQPGVAVKAWDPKTPYVAKLKAARPADRLAVYLAQRKDHANSPAFFFDCANCLFSAKQPELAVQVLSNVAELELENAALLRVAAYKLAEEGQLDLAIDTFEKVRKLRPEEPQSHRDLALALARRADAEAAAGQSESAASDYHRALELLAHVVMKTWDRFEQIEVIALMELNAMVPRAKAAGAADLPLDARLLKLLDCDVRIVMAWDADLTDIDLHVVEPSGEEAMYDHNRTTIGGAVSRDFTQGYGPEEYTLRRAMHGAYKVRAHYYGSNAQTIQGPVTLQLDIFTNFGRPTQKRQTVTLRLTEAKEMLDVAEVEF